jgi:hypothetical protein
MKRRDVVKVLSVVSCGLFFPGGRRVLADPPEPDASIRRVLVMFKCHFDAGFIDTQTAVVQKYFTQFFPLAMEVARSQNASGKRRYVWTTGSWLLFEYLEQASSADRRQMEQAIVAGDIAWHALPFTWQSELLEPSMIEGALALSQSLDKRFGKVTTGAKMTDVPGHTRGLIRPLADNGVSFLEIGVNGGSTPAQVPPIFLWRDSTGKSLPVMYHHEYGGTVRVPGSDLALVTVVRDDNSGPHTPAEIASIHADLAARFPEAEIAACGLTEMSNALAPYRGQLPILTQEIGDTWIYGVPSDPLKIARFREVARLRLDWIRAGHFKVGDATDLQLLRRLLLEVEHTWGTDTKTWLDFDHYTPSDLAPMLDTKNYKVVQFSWAEKRQDLFQGLASLPDQLRTEALDALKQLSPRKPQVPAGAASHKAEELIETTHFFLAIDSRTGALAGLRNKATGHEWASPIHPVGLLTYQTLSKADYDRFIAAYLTTTQDWAFKDFGKPNIERFGAESQTWQPALASVHSWREGNAWRILIQPQFQDDEAFRVGRASFPHEVFLQLTLPDNEPAIHINLSCFSKPATRLPEALWFTFNPIAEDKDGWKLEKSGESVSLFDVVPAGGRHMHSLSSGFSYRNGEHSFEVDTIDAPVTALGTRTPLGFSAAQPDLVSGIHSCLFNNAWGTNYIMWYGEDMLFRFTLRAD